MTDDSLRAQLQATLGDTHSIERELGGGGMSRVFVAEDTRLGRKVVVKVLTPELAAGLSIARFEQEIRLAASLQQANIVPVISAGETDGLPWYTMPFVDGLSLRARLSRSGSMPVAEVVSVLRDVARALAYAHEHGVVHRDIKPENVLLSGDAAVVTDFGIAKALSASRTKAPGGTLTQVGTSLGTPAYMAPEQASADPATDHRADLYALGCVAYEMLAGTAPFAGRPAHQLFAAHLNDTPAPIARADVPRSLSALVSRCMAKDPASRPQSAREVLQALETVTSGPSVTPRAVRARWAAVAVAMLIVVLGAGAFGWKRTRGAAPQSLSSVAVLPFENASGDTASNYFADGMTDELATALAKVPGLQVASRTSSYTFRRHEGLDAPAIAAKLGVGAIIEGSVRRSGSQLRLTAQLTRASDGRSVWADAFTADAGDVFAVQARLTQAIVAAVTPTLSGQPAAALAATTTPGTKNQVAYDFYLRARYQLNRRGPGVRESIPLFQQAIQNDSTFAPAWAGLASAWAVLSDYDPRVKVSITLDSARISGARAMALDPLAGEPYTAAGYALGQTGDFAAARPLLQRGVALAPQSDIAHRWLAGVEERAGNYPVAERAYRDAAASDPLSAVTTSNLATTISLDPARAEEAHVLARRAISLDPSNVGAANNASAVLYITGYRAEAMALVRTPALRELLAHYPARVAGLAALGFRDSVERIMREEKALPRTPMTWQRAAVGHAVLGQWDSAFAVADSLTRATGSLHSVLVYAAVWQPVARDPRWRVMCARTRMDCDAALAVLARFATPVPVR